MDIGNDDVVEINDETMKDSEAGKTSDTSAAAAAADDDDDDDDKMMREDDLKQEQPDHIKLVMEVRILCLISQSVSK